MASSVEEVLKRRIADRGPIPFAEFMELALYWPHGGYYPQARFGDYAGDFFTAPAAHPAFGALLCLQLEEMWRLLDCPPRFTIVEQGAGGGLLARDIRRYAGHLEPRFHRAIRYIAIERRPPARPVRDTAAVASEPTGTPVEWIQSVGLPLHGITGCVLSNELLDVFPVHRVTVHQGRLQEIYVGLKDGRFIEVMGEPSTTALGDRLQEEGVTLAENQRAEVCLALEPWIQQVTACLKRGFVLTIDYGHTAQTLYAPERLRGSLRCFYQHTMSMNPYVRVGDQDITSHVDFTAVMALGQRHGLANLGLERQATFLANLGLGTLQRRLAGSDLGQRERDANRMGMLELARAGAMGEFKVLVQSTGVGTPKITGLEGASPPWSERLRELTLPLLEEEHLQLMEARYPHTAWEWEEPEQ